ncbi:DMT family transporter [Gordonia desulfuricans]|uniref:DMT family transporter n=1 Tax=Gordonia desulfuricans TaxID=89051 RepID=A0A7K3LLT6_9ACTN|nr:DMT family transporter [Gordonia desulfuricans]NDK89188.1 DMT family transporter [Gordonia desulfuricans]
MTRQPVNLSTLAATVTVVLWALSFIAIRSAGHAFTPGVMALGRLAVAVVALVAIVITLRRKRLRSAFIPPRGRALALVVAYGVAWFGAYTVVLNWAEQHIDAGTAALLVNFAPILVAVFAGFFLGEGFSPPLVIGIAIGFVGVVLITFGGGSAHADWLGVGLGLLAALLYAAGVLLQKVALGAVDAVSATFWGALAGLVVTLPFLPAAITEVGQASAADLGWVVFLGVGPTAVAFTTWAYALARTDAGTMAATTLVVPALVIILSWLLLDEVPTGLRIAGGALSLAGVALTRGLIPVPRRRSGVPRPVARGARVESELKEHEIEP